MSRERNDDRTRYGMTLVELLMVVAIMTILMAVAIPMIRPAFQDRVLREASRQINAFFAGAKARAAESGHPVGVWIERRRSEDNHLYSTQLHIAEVSSSFTGAVVGSRATILFPASITIPAPPVVPEWPHEFDYTNLGELYFWNEAGTNIDASTAGYLVELVANYEIFFIRFDHKGYYYGCMRYDMGGVPHFLISVSSGVIPPRTEHVVPPVVPAGLTFEILRSPSKSIVSPLTLPGDTILDMTVSGMGLGQYADAFDYEWIPPPPPDPLPPPTPVIVMFTPTGEVGYVYVDNVAKIASGPVYLLVGRRSKITLSASFANPEFSNLAEPTNLWITINNRTGAVTTEDNAVPPVLAGSPSFTEYLRAARSFARGSQQKGGR